MRLLLAVDQTEEGAALSKFLDRSGFRIDVENAGTDIIAKVNATAYDLLIMSAASGAVDGFTAVRRIRCFSSVPILLITSGQDWQDRVLGLTLGADDCLSRPFRDEELLARIAAMLRRAPAASIPQAVRVGEFELHPGSQQAYYRERFLDLTPTECQILELMLRQYGRTVSRDQITLHLYGRALSPLDRSIDTHVSRIRKKLGDAGHYIKSVRGTGYQLCPQVEASCTVDPTPAPPKIRAGEHR